MTAATVRRRELIISIVILLGATALCLRRPLFGRESYIPPGEWLEANLGSAETLGWEGRTFPRSGDQVWSFSSPPASWRELMGTRGRCLIRGGKVLDGYVTEVN